MNSSQSTGHVRDRHHPPITPATALVFDTTTGTVIPVAEPDEHTDSHTARVLELRTAATIAGQCPECGARIELPNRAARRDAKRAGYALRARMPHEDGCPAIDARVPMAGVEGLRVAR